MSNDTVLHADLKPRDFALREEVGHLALFSRVCKACMVSSGDRVGKCLNGKWKVTVKVGREVGGGWVCPKQS